jgi:hypothetical protein
LIWTNSLPMWVFEHQLERYRCCRPVQAEMSVWRS